MFISSIKLSSIIYTAGNDYNYGTQQILIEQEAVMRDNLQEIEFILKDMKTSRDEEIEIFTTTFEGIVVDYTKKAGRYNVIWKLLPTLEALSIMVYPVKTPHLNT